MDPAGFCQQARVLIVAGKGGVGKTTVSAALARMAALSGLRPLIVEVEGRSGICAALGYQGQLTYQEVDLVPAGRPSQVPLAPAPAGPGGPVGSGPPPQPKAVRARTLTPDDALLEYLLDHGMRRISKRLVSSGALDVVATAAPGIRDILVLGKVKQLERANVADLIVLDAPAAGHAVRFLTSAHGLLDAIRVGPIRSQAADVVDLLTDPSRCQVLLVTLPEETPVNEVVETAHKLRDRVGVSLGPIVVNGLYPALDGLDADPEGAAGAPGAYLRPGEADSLRAAAGFRRDRQKLHAEQLARLAESLPLPQLRLPYLFTPEVGPVEMDTLAAELGRGIRSLPEPADTAGSRR
jgi:anion-transporting  ArsA/GET3 family ATPase